MNVATMHNFSMLTKTDHGKIQAQCIKHLYTYVAMLKIKFCDKLPYDKLTYSYKMISLSLNLKLLQTLDHFLKKIQLP